ncbi:MAG: tripartite tricarboxylate transporter TctB family protein [Betaproteobacteria bacterium]
MGMIRHPKDFVAGLLFVATGAAAILIAANYPLGTAARMGPGYFPRILGILLILLGSALSLRGLRLQGSPLPGWRWRPIIIVLGSVVLFGLVVNIVGLAISTVGLIILSSAASSEFRPKEAIIAGFALAILSVAVFVMALKLQLPIWPAFR